MPQFIGIWQRTVKRPDGRPKLEVWTRDGRAQTAEEFEQKALSNLAGRFSERPGSTPERVCILERVTVSVSALWELTADDKVLLNVPDKEAEDGEVHSP